MFALDASSWSCVAWLLALFLSEHLRVLGKFCKDLINLEVQDIANHIVLLSVRRSNYPKELFDPDGYAYDLYYDRLQRASQRAQAESKVLANPVYQRACGEYDDEM